MLTAAQRDTFKVRGLVRLPDILPTENANRSREEILRLCEKHGFWRDGRWQHHSPSAQSRLRKRLKGSTVRGGFMSPRVHDCMAQLVEGADLTQFSSSPELLFSQPSRRDGAFNASSGDTAAKPSANRPFPWHVDVPRLSNTGIVGVQVFTFLDTVKPGGGGTAVVTGSHRLLNNCGAVSIEGVNRHLDGEPFFRDLFATRRAEGQQLFAANGRVRGVDLEVVELVGEPGDVYLMDLRALHTRCPNTRPTPRMMIAQRFILASVRSQIRRRYFELDSQ